MIWIISLAFFSLVFVWAQESEAEKIKRTVLLLPIRNLTANEEYASLAYTIFNVFEINLENQDSLDLVHDEKQIGAAAGTSNFEALMKNIEQSYNAETCVLAEYYVALETLHITITVVDVATARIKNCYIRTMPADQGRYETLDTMSREISIAIGRDLPALEREALMKKQIVARLRDKLDSEERLVNDISGKRNEITLLPFAGIDLGRTVISWAKDRPPFFLPLRLEYSYFFDDSYQVRAGVEYAPFDLMVPDVKRFETGVDILFGFHTRSLFSFGFDTGLALTYDHNDKSMVFSNTDGTQTGATDRLSLSIPLLLTWSLYLDRSFFIGFRVADYGLTYTFEWSDPSEYAGGSSTLFYNYGFSPFNFLCISLSASVGVRF
jgi:hypothetical protein